MLTLTMETLEATQTEIVLAKTPDISKLSVNDDDAPAGIRFVDYVDESQLDNVMSLVGRDLSEPYSSAYL